MSRIQSCLRHRIETRLSDQQTAEYGSPVPSVLLQASSSPRQFSFTIISLVECSFPKSAQLLLRLIILREGFVCSKPSVCSYFCKQICKGGRVFCVRTFFPRNRSRRSEVLRGCSGSQRQPKSLWSTNTAIVLVSVLLPCQRGYCG